MVRKGYRDPPYHNWLHAFSVTHFAYLLIHNLRLTERGALTHLEALALIVSSMCHDLDHRGTTNSFQVCDGRPQLSWKMMEGDFFMSFIMWKWSHTHTILYSNWLRENYILISHENIFSHMKTSSYAGGLSRRGYYYLSTILILRNIMYTTLQEANVSSPSPSVNTGGEQLGAGIAVLVWRVSDGAAPLGPGHVYPQHRWLQFPWEPHSPRVHQIPWPNEGHHPWSVVYKCSVSMSISLWLLLSPFENHLHAHEPMITHTSSEYGSILSCFHCSHGLGTPPEDCFWIARNCSKWFWVSQCKAPPAAYLSTYDCCWSLRPD